jgi:cell division protein FtsW (lipid II flippase)
MKNYKSLLLTFVLSLIPLIFMIMSLSEIYEVLFGKGGYTFGVDNPYSIYKSKEIYLIYNIVASLIHGLNIYFAFKEWWKLYLISLVLVLLLIYYPTSSIAESV